MKCFILGELVTVTKGQYKSIDAKVIDNQSSSIWVMILATTEVVSIPENDLVKFDYTKLNSKNKTQLL